MKKPTVKVRKTGTCELFSTFPMKCPLCDTLVPANTPHTCQRLETSK